MLIRSKFIPSKDGLDDSSSLKVEVIDSNGLVVDTTVLRASDFISEDNRRAVRIFAHGVDEEFRKVNYRKEHGNNSEAIRIEIREDRYEAFFRDRRDRERYEGLGDAAISEWQRHR